MKLRVNPEAINDIADIKKYIRDELGNPAAAKRVVDNIVKSYKSLRKTPYIGQQLSALIRIANDYRYLVCGNYLIFYKTDVNIISVHRVLYGKRDYCSILFNFDSSVDLFSSENQE